MVSGTIGHLKDRPLAGSLRRLAGETPSQQNHCSHIGEKSQRLHLTPVIL